MSIKSKDILIFIFKVLVTSSFWVSILRIYVWYYNKSLDTFANVLFYLSLSFLIFGFISILLILLKQEQKNVTYKRLMSIATLIVFDGIVFIVISFFLTFLISFQNSV